MRAHPVKSQHPPQSQCPLDANNTFSAAPSERSGRGAPCKKPSPYCGTAAAGHHGPRHSRHAATARARLGTGTESCCPCTGSCGRLGHLGEEREGECVAAHGRETKGDDKRGKEFSFKNITSAPAADQVTAQFSCCCWVCCLAALSAAASHHAPGCNAHAHANAIHPRDGGQASAAAAPLTRRARQQWRPPRPPRAAPRASAHAPWPASPARL
jgi:hypothetical protein